MKWLSLICALYIALLIVQPAMACADAAVETSCCEDSGCGEEGEESPGTCAGESCNPFQVQACACCVGFTPDIFIYTLTASTISFSFLQTQEVKVLPRSASDVWQPPRQS